MVIEHFWNYILYEIALLKIYDTDVTSLLRLINVINLENFVNSKKIMYKKWNGNEIILQILNNYKVPLYFV